MTDYSSLYITVPIMVLCLVIFARSLWKQKKYVPGNPPLISPIYIQITALIIFLVLTSNLIVVLTGSSWQSPFSSFGR